MKGVISTLASTLSSSAAERDPTVADRARQMKLQNSNWTSTGVPRKNHT